MVYGDGEPDMTRIEDTYRPGYIIEDNIGFWDKIDQTHQNAIIQALYYEKIIAITASTQMTAPKHDIVLNKSDWGKLLDKLTTYSLNPIGEAEDENGWEYRFKIEQEDDITVIAFMKDRVVVDGIVYEVEDYNSGDFLYLFE